MKKILILVFLALMGVGAQAQTITGGYCTIADTIYKGDGTRFPGARVIVSRVEKSGRMISLGPHTYVANASGYVSFTVPQGATCYVFANISGYNTPPNGAQVTIPDSSGSTCTYNLRSLQPASTTVSTNAGFVRLREVDRSPAYTISGNDDTLEVSNSTLSNPSSRVFRIAIIEATDDVDWTGTHTFDDFIKKADMLEYLGGALEATSASGAGDSTAFYIPMKMFSLSDTATIDFSTSKRFASLDSIVLLGGTRSTLGDSAAFSIRIKQTVLNGSYTGAFNAAAIDSSDLGAGNVQRRWKFTSFGSLTASARATIRAKIWRSACTNNTGSDVYLERILIYGVGLR